MSAVERVRAAYARMREVDRPEVWITVRDEDDALAEAAEVDLGVAAGERLPLAGTVVAVKDNIDVEGMSTTAGSRAYAYRPERDATAVARLRAAGAVVIGKTNLDQFATGLVGTRSPFGAVRNAWDPTRISGGSSSGSAVAVALGIVDLALGTDTAGSGRVPAALNGIVGVKPTVGLVPATGVVPACRTLDCVTVFARGLSDARAAAEIMAGPDGIDPLGRDDRPEPPLDARPRVAVPTAAHLAGLADGWAEAFAGVVAALAASGVEIVEVDIAPLLEAASLLYGRAFVAERTAAVGAFIAARVRAFERGRDRRAPEGAGGPRLLRKVRHRARTLDRGVPGLSSSMPPETSMTTPVLIVAAGPVGANSRMGRYTNFANLLDRSALAVPAGVVGGRAFGVMLTGAPFADRTLAQLAERIQAPSVDLLVVGAHLRGQPLNHQLVAAGGTFVAEVETAAQYRLYALDTVPPKPGLARAADGGAAIAGEVWRLPAAGFGRFVADLPAPMGIGSAVLADGSSVTGFLCEAVALEGATDITAHGGWRAYRAATA